MSFWTQQELIKLLKDIPSDLGQADIILVAHDNNTGVAASAATAGTGGVAQFFFDQKTLATDYSVLATDVKNHDLFDASGQAITVLADLGNLAADVTSDINTLHITSVRAEGILAWIGVDLVQDVLQLSGLAAPSWDHWYHV